MPLHVTRAQAARLARNVGADPLPPKRARPRRVPRDQQLVIAGWMPRCRVVDGVEVYDYWQAAGSGESAGAAATYTRARRRALDRLVPD